MYKTVTKKSVLTPRERTILEYLIQGETQGSIAFSLGITERIVNRHVSSIRKKTETKSTVAAVAVAIKRGLI